MDFDENQLLEVFSWLPTKSVARFKSVSKQCKKILDQEFFVKKHIENMKKMKVDSLFIQPYSCQKMQDELELRSLYTATDEVSSSIIPSDSLRFVKTNGRLIASYNGLLCCRVVTRDIENLLFVCNPATRTWLPVPKSSDGDNDMKEEHFALIFGSNDHNSRADVSDDYLLILLMNDTTIDWNDTVICKTYSSREGMWRETTTIHGGSRDILMAAPVFDGNSKIYFISTTFPFLDPKSQYYRPYMVVYDIQSRKSKFLRLPKDARRGSEHRSCQMGIFKKRNNSICVIRLRKGLFTGWVLTDVDAGKWVRIFKIRVENMGVKRSNSTISGFAPLNDGDLLAFSMDEKIYIFDLTTNGGDGNTRARELCNHEFNGVILHPYLCTLRPCGSGAIPLPQFFLD